MLKTGTKAIKTEDGGWSVAGPGGGAEKFLGLTRVDDGGFCRGFRRFWRTKLRSFWGWREGGEGMRPMRRMGPNAEARRRRGEIVGGGGTNATNGCAVAGQRNPAGGRRGGEPSVAGLDCEHGGSSWRGRYPSQGEFSRVGGFAKLAANGKCVNGWEGGEFSFKKQLRSGGDAASRFIYPQEGYPVRPARRTVLTNQSCCSPPVSRNAP